MCHDYKAPGRDRFAWETTIGAERTANVHVHEGVSEEEFVAMRTARDKTLGMPQAHPAFASDQHARRTAARARRQWRPLPQASDRLAVSLSDAF